MKYSINTLKDLRTNYDMFVKTGILPAAMYSLDKHIIICYITSVFDAMLHNRINAKSPFPAEPIHK